MDVADYSSKLYDFHRGYFTPAPPNVDPPPGGPLPDEQGGIEHEPPPPALPDDDFMQRATMPGVLSYQGFDDLDSVRAGIQRGNVTTPVLDFAIKAHGLASLRFDVPAGSDANGAGSFVHNFTPDLSKRFGANEKFSVQWRQRFNRAMIDTIFLEEGGGRQGGIKQAIITTGDVLDPGAPYGVRTANSCTAIGLVVQTYYQRRFPIVYNSCTGSKSHGPYAGLYEPRDGGMEYLLQNGTAPFCRYTASGEDATETMAPGCFGWVADQFMTFEVGVQLGPLIDGEFVNSVVDFWAAHEGGAPVHLVSWHPGVSGYFNLSAGALDELFGKLWLLAYMTNKSMTQVHELAQTWYDGLIVSREPIPFPGMLPVTPTAYVPPVAIDPAPTPAPAATWATVGHDADLNVKVDAGVYRYGVDTRWTYLRLPAGTYTVLPETWGIPDPAFKVVKSLDRWTGAGDPDVTPIITPGATPSTTPATKPPLPATPPVVITPSRTAPKWLKGVKVGEWIELPGTENCSGVIPWEGSINAWNGLAASDTAFWSAAAGGHGEWWNPVLTIDFLADAPAWRLVRATTPFELVSYGPRYKDGSACSRHLYTNIQWLAAEHAKDGHAHILLTGSYATYAFELTAADGTLGFNGGPQMDSFSVDSGEWDPAGTFPNMPLWQELPVVTRDRRDGRIYYVCGYTYSRWDPKSNTWDMPGGRAGYSDTGLAAWDRRCCAIDVKRNQLVGIIDTRGPLRVERVDLATNAVTNVPIIGMPNVNEGSAMTVDEDGDRYLYIDQGKEWTINPDTGVASQVDEITSAKRSTENRFAYFPMLGGIGYVPTFEAPAMFKRTG